MNNFKFNKIKKESSKNYETAKGRHTMIMNEHPSINSNTENDISLNKNDSQNNMTLDSVNNSYDNIELSHNNISDINSSNNLASNGRKIRYQAFNDLIGNKMDNTNNINSSVEANNYKIDSNLITPTANKIFESNTLINTNKTNNLNIKQNQPKETELNIINQINNSNNNNQSTNNLVHSSFINDTSNVFNINVNQGNKNNTLFNDNNNKNTNKGINLGMYDINYPKDLNLNNKASNGINIDIQNKANENHNHIPNVFQSILNNQNNNMNNLKQNETSNIFDINSNKKINITTNINSMEGISPINENRTLNQINSNQSNNSSINQSINNFLTSTFNKEEQQEISNPFDLDKINRSSSEKEQIKANDNINIRKHIQIQTSHTPSNVNLGINNNDSNSNSNYINGFTFNQNNVNSITHIPTQSGEYNSQILQITKNTNNINNDSNNLSINNNIQTQADVSQSNDKNLVSVIARQILVTKDELNEQANASKNNNKFHTIVEESLESESGLKKMNTESKDISLQYYLKKGFVLCPIPGTNKLKIITQDEKDEAVITVVFPEEIGITCFLEDCAYCNMYPKLYITGGKLKNNDTNSKNSLYSNKLLVVDLFQTTLDGKNSIVSELNPMTYPAIKHSMIGYDDKIYVVGGENSDTVERYDIKSNKWELLNPMMCCRSYPNLCINDGYLYAFFGMNKDGYTKNIERLNLTNPEPLVWEMVFFDNPNNVDVRIYGCGIYPIEGLIYFFGGKCMGQDTDEIFFFNPKERLIDKSDAKLKWKESFRENTLFQFENKVVQISDGKYYGNYIKIIVE